MPVHFRSPEPDFVAPHFFTKVESFAWRVAWTALVLIQIVLWEKKASELFTGNAWRYALHNTTVEYLRSSFCWRLLTVQVVQQAYWGGLKLFHPWQGCSKDDEHFHCMSVNELWLARHHPPHKGTILKHFYPGSASLVTKWPWNFELQHVLSCKLFIPSVKN